MISITENARNKVNELLEHHNTKYLKVGVDSGGCSGFRYHFELGNKIEEDEVLLEDGIITDNISLELLDGSTLDYIKEPFNETFHWNNPNAKSKCGCGASFS